MIKDNKIMSEKRIPSKDSLIETNHLEIVDTFQDAGTRPIEESPGFLVVEEEDTKYFKEQDISTNRSSESKINSIPPLD